MEGHSQAQVLGCTVTLLPSFVAVHRVIRFLDPLTLNHLSLTPIRSSLPHH